jgi:crotonobetaine/carnitine-CoA ligase
MHLRMEPTFDPADVAAFQMTGQDIPWLLRHWAEHKPEHPFLIWEPRAGGERIWTYRQFLDDASSLAAGLVARGVAKGDKVLIHSENSPEMVLSWYACSLVGACAVTTNTRSAGAELEYFAQHTRCVAAITQPQFAALVTENAPGLKWVAVTEDDSGAPAADREAVEGLVPFADLMGDAATLQERPAEPMLPAGIMFTSGTTSRPKAVVHTHANAVWASRNGPVNIDLRTDDVYLVYLPFFHVNAQSWSIWSTLGAGSTVVLQPKYSASRFWEVVQRHGVTHISVIPFVFKGIADQPVPDHTIRVGVFGLTMPVIEGWLGFKLTTSWGMTETVIHATRNDFHQHYPDGTMGRPSPGYEFLVVNNDTGQVCAPGEIGELWVRGTRGIQLFLEYFDNDEANAKSFTDDGWFKTGDNVTMSADGYLYFRDRDKDALKVGGENVSAREVEDVCRQVPGIADIAVVGQKHDFLDQVAVAFVVPAPGAPDDLPQQIIDHCASQLADFKTPRAVYLVDEFPTATLDKVAKNKLREMADARLDEA